MNEIQNMLSKVEIVVVILFTLITFSKGDTLYTDKHIIVVGESSLQYHRGIISEHMTAMYKIWDWYKIEVHDSNFIKPYDTLNPKHIVRARIFPDELEYHSLPFGGMVARINNNQIIRISPYRIKVGNKPTSIELNEYEKTKIIPKSFKNIRQDSALYIAREFQKTGIINSYNGDLNLRYNLDYIPKITKEEALTIYKEHMEKNNDMAVVKTIRLSKSNRSKERWGWNIFATPPGKGGFNYLIIIDSENGAILHDFRF